MDTRHQLRLAVISLQLRGLKNSAKWAAEQLEGLADYAFIMEPDALPIRAGWLDRLVQESAAMPCHDFWLKGSMPRCKRVISGRAELTWRGRRRRMHR